MKKTFKSYFAIWATLLASYNLIVFLARSIIPGYSIHYDARFWVSWGVIFTAFIGQLFCAKIAFDAKNNEKFFLNIPIITQSYTTLIIVTIVGSVLMLIPDCPAWIAAIVCTVALGLSIISVVKAKTATDIVSEVDDRIKEQTFFIKSLTAEAEGLVARAQNDEIKNECKKVYESVRYSDPMSHSMLGATESQITIKFAELTDAVNAGDYDAIKLLAREVIVLVDDRNKKCKLLK